MAKQPMPKISTQWMSPTAAQEAARGPDVTSPSEQPTLSRLCRSAMTDSDLSSGAFAARAAGPSQVLKPEPGDMALFEVVDLGRSSSLLAADGGRRPLRRGDRFVGVFGNHHDGADLEARVQGIDRLSLLNEMGLVGTVYRRQLLARGPTAVRFRGFAQDRSGDRANVRQMLFRPPAFPASVQNIYLAVGCAWGTGRASAVVRLCRALGDRGLEVAACRLTGGDGRAGRPSELPVSIAHSDFGGFGLPSTYLLSTGELRSLFGALVGDVATVRPDVVLMELGDAVLQRESALVLADPWIRERVRGVILTAACTGSALFGLSWARARGHRVVALSGVLESAPLLLQELRQQTAVPVGSLSGTGRQLADIVAQDLGIRV